jgi:hypothetical protein
MSRNVFCTETETVQGAADTLPRAFNPLLFNLPINVRDD